MGASSLGMALIPTYQDIGILATIILLILRFFQGIAFGGEFPTTMVLLYEVAPPKRKSFYCSFTSTSSLLGVLIAIVSIVSLTITMGNNNFYSFGWRFLFGLSIFFGFIIGYLRFSLVETLRPDIIEEMPTISTIKNWKIMINGVLLYAVTNILFFSYTFHVSTRLINVHQLTETQSYMLQITMIIYLMFALPIMGFISDKVDKYVFGKYTLIFVILFAYFAYWFLYSYSLYIVGIITLGLFVAAVIAFVNPVLVEYSKISCRVSTVGVVDGSSTLLFGASAPLVNEVLIQAFGRMSPSYYLIVIGCLAFCAFMKIKRNVSKY